MFCFLIGIGIAALVLLALPLGMTILIGYWEELVFRGYLQSQLAARFRSPLVWIVLPSLMQSPKLLLLLEDFSNAARYQNSLSSFDWHLRDTVGIQDFVREARELDPGEFAD